MVKNLKANLLYLMYDHRFSLIVFWSVLLSSSFVLFLIAVVLSDGSVGLSLGVAIYIFCGITGFLLTKETFPYLVKLGSTRNTFIFSVIAFNLILATFMTVVMVVVFQLVETLNLIVDLEYFNVFSALEATTLAPTWYNELWFSVIICFLLLSLGFLLGAIFYRFGLIGGFSGLVLAVLIIILPGARSLVSDIFINNFVDFKLDLNYFAIVILAISVFVPSWLLLRNASTTASATR